MPSSPFRDAGAPFKVMRVHSHESAIDPTGQPYIKAMLVITSDLSGDQGREFRVTDGDMVRLSHMTAAPTPPDFDAAVDDLETRASLYHSSGGPNRTHYRNDLTAARQRVRELYEAVVRERDEYFMDMVEANHEAAAYSRELRAAGEVFTVELIGDNEILGVHLWADQYVPGDKVRITRVEEGA